MPRGSVAYKRTKAEMLAHRASLSVGPRSCGHVGVSANDYYRGTTGGRGPCVECYQETERERQRSYQFSAPVSLKTAGHAYTREQLRDPEVEAALGVLRDAKAQRDGKQGYVYLIVEDLPGGGLVYGKVGYSVNPPKRVAELQTGNPRVLRLHAMRPGTPADERRLHAKYIKRNVLQEWFRITKELLLEWDAEHLIRERAVA